MSHITHTIGWGFEQILQKEFPDFRNRTQEGRVPDFEHDLFWVEAKVALDKPDYGIIPKEFQLLEYPIVTNKPLVYFCGFHNLFFPSKKIKQKTDGGRKRFVSRHMDITRVFVVSHDIMLRIDERHRVLNTKGNISYTGVPPSFFQRILDNGNITHLGIKKKMHSHLEINPQEFDLSYPVTLHSNIPYGWILHKDYDAPVLDFLKNLHEDNI